MKLQLRSVSRLFLLLIITAFSATFITIQDNANAVSATDFNAGRIIDDVVFYDKNSMSVNDIQVFLNNLISNCDTWGTGPSEYGGGTRAQYAASVGWPGPPYACLNNYHENPSTGETSFEKGGGAFAGGLSAAQIIYDAAQTYNISPKVILVLLKKESPGPITADLWPLKTQYKYAMGYACPDSGPGYSASCDAEKSGFYNQVMLAAWQLNYYREHPNDYRYGIGVNSIQYSPDPGCGTKQVNIENISTLSLYIYTPYTPNDSALANYPGVAHCGAYGNRNFFMYYNEWFGSTYGNRWSPLKDPRVLVTKAETFKINPDTGEQVQSLPLGLQIAFPTKTTLPNGEGCLRTQFDTNNNTNTCIKLSDLEEFNPIFEDITPDGTAIQKQTVRWTCKVNYHNLQARGDQCFDGSTKILFIKKVNVAGVDYLITQKDWLNNVSLAFRLDRTEDIPVQIMNPLTDSEKIRTNIQWTCKVNTENLEVDYSQCYPKDTIMEFAKKTTVNNEIIIITRHDDFYGNNKAFLEKRFVIE